MNQIIGSSESGDLNEALKGITGTPALLMLLSSTDKFTEHCAELKKRFPDVPQIGCKLYFYDSAFHEKLGVVAFYGVTAVTGVLRNVSKAPITDICSYESNIRKISPGHEDTVCIGFCTGNDACVLTTLSVVLERNGIQLTGGTAWDNMVMVDGVIYNDADAYALVKNTGKVRVYKENLYRPRNNVRYIASKTNTEKYYIGELNGRPAKQVYTEVNHIRDTDVSEHTKKSPFGRLVGKDIFLVGLDDVSGSGLTCFRQVNDSDVLYMMDILDFNTTVNKTIERIKKDFSRISGSFSVNCLYRYNIFSDSGYLGEYLRLMSQITNYCGIIGYGEHYNSHFINQSMSCVIFE